MADEGYTPETCAMYNRMIGDAQVWANNPLVRQVLVQALVAENKRMQRKAHQWMRKLHAANDHDGAEAYGNNSAMWIELNRRLMVQLWPDRADDINADNLKFG